MPPCLPLATRLPAVFHHVRSFTRLHPVQVALHRARHRTWPRCLHRSYSVAFEGRRDESSVHDSAQTRAALHRHASQGSSNLAGAISPDIATEMILAGYEATAVGQHSIPEEEAATTESSPSPNIIRKLKSPRALDTRMNRLERNAKRLADKASSLPKEDKGSRKAKKYARFKKQQLEGLKFKQRALAIKTKRRYWAAITKDGQGVPTKMLKINPNNSEVRVVIGVWTPRFTRLYSRYDVLYSGQKLDNLSFHTLACSWSERLLRCKTSEDAEAALNDIAVRSSMSPACVWCHTLIWLLNTNATDAVEFLRSTHAFGFIPVQCIDDSIAYLAAYCHAKTVVPSETEALRTSLVDLISALSNHPRDRPCSLEGASVRNLLDICNTDQTDQIYTAIRAKKLRTTWISLLQFAAHYAKLNRFEQALDAVLESSYLGADLTSNTFSAVCAILFRQVKDRPDGLRICLHIVPRLVEIGVQLNTQLCNILILNSAEAGDFNTAYRIYGSLLEYGVKADGYTYAVLFKAWKSDINNVEMLNEIIRNAIANIDLSQHPTVAAELLHCLALHHAARNPTSCYEPVLQAYLQFYHADTLEKLGLAIPTASAEIPRTREAVDPHPEAVHILLHTYLIGTSEHRNAQLSKETVQNATSCMSRFLALARNRVQPFAEMAANPHTFNTLLLGLVRHSSGLHQATQLFQAMQSSLKPGRGGLPYPCAPDLHTYSILIKGFARGGETRKAESIINFMQEQGHQPNLITWNTLLSGYASEQYHDGVVATLKRIDENGFTWDRFTRGALRKLRNPIVWQKTDTASSLDFTDDIQTGLETRISRIPAAKVAEFQGLQA
ncbi:hypothetical protein K431DRAFT_283969 [Polychaeton citri CBS 116435]|uniref:Pentatricopeptide repeat protein n=1 Tax=Polychaeton citri CBS 116435 TaxID=1314669 RepID=A0A9P4QD87_9PEZI|nr:hypothetical protein K431DRAFT_283969 [Polychaeton citri CBS 116435]